MSDENDRASALVGLRQRSGTGTSLFGHRREPEVEAPAPSLRPLREILAPRHDPERIVADLPVITIDPDHAAKGHVYLDRTLDPVGQMFDLLRTQLLQVLLERGWHRVAVTAPERGCGASFVALNLALSLARRHVGRTILVDLDLRAPSLADTLGVKAPGAMRDLLTGAQPMETLLCRHGHGLILGLNAQPESDAAELLQSPGTALALEAMIDDLAPDVVLYDLPPVLGTDDVLAILPEVDGVVLVSDGSRTSAEDIENCERLFKDRTCLIAVVLNRAEDRPARRKR
jgi:Mrp family chromosome partitioning ATPase